MSKDPLDELIVEPYYYKIGKWKYTSYGRGYRIAVRRIAKQVQKDFKQMKNLPMLVQVKHKEELHYWDIREFLKEAGIKIKVELNEQR